MHSFAELTDMTGKVWLTSRFKQALYMGLLLVKRSRTPTFQEKRIALLIAKEIEIV
jgi:hypothetical protein